MHFEWDKKTGMIFINGQKILHRYVLDKNNIKVGAVVAIPIDGEIHYGFSKIHKLDQNKHFLSTEKGRRNFLIKVAVGRALKRADIQYPFQNVHIPSDIRNSLINLFNRANRYFKVNNISKHWYRGWHDVEGNIYVDEAHNPEDLRTQCSAERDNT